MRFPHTPPDGAATFRNVVAHSAERTATFFAASKLVDAKGRYLHWDELRFKPAPGGLSSEEWWTAVRMARTVAEQELPLVDINESPFSFCEPMGLKSALRYLDMNAGGALRADSQGLSSGEGRAHLTSSLAEEPFASSYIEGAATTRQVARKLIFEGRQPRTVDELMVLNNYRAMELVKAKKDEPLTMDLLLRLHRTVTQGTLESESDAGRVRTTDDVRVVDSSNDEVLFQPPRSEDLPDRLQKLFDFANQDNSADEWTHPLIKAMIMHFMIAYEHPFVDGNGRVARALFYWYALKAGYWLLEYVSISTVIAESKIDYGRSFLFVETDNSDMTYFIDNQAKTLRKALESLHKYIERRKSEVRQLEDRLTDWKRPDAFNHRQVTLLNEFLREKISHITISDQEKKHGVSYLTARSDLEKLEVEGYLSKGKRGAQSIYRPVNNLVTKLQEAT